MAVPSALVLAALVWHSVRAMPRQRALLFWLSVIVYGVLRGLGVRAVTTEIGASFPYEIRGALLEIGGVSAQEVAGWGIVAYLGWWIGDRFARHSRRPSLFLSVAWASLFLGGISWAIEAAAIGARWWHWTVPTASRVFLNVPAIGIVDWFFVAIDFLLPFAAITAPSMRGVRWRYLTLLLFPAHFAGHLLPGAWLHAVHWWLVLTATGLALRAGADDRPFNDVRSWIPSVAFGVVVLDVALVDLFVVRRPELLQSIAPVVGVWLSALHPASAIMLGVASVAAAIRLPSMLVGAAVVAGGMLLVRLQARRMVVVPLTVLVVFAVVFHRTTAAARAELTSRLDRAIAERQSGNLDRALAEFDAIARDHPTSYVPLALGAEIDYRRNDFDAAHGKLARAVEMKQDFVRGYRLLAAIELQRGNRGGALSWARRGLEVAPGDLQLRFLAGEHVLDAIDTPQTAAGMVALAYEVGELTEAQRIVEWGVARWPDDPRLRGLSKRLHRGDGSSRSRPSSTPPGGPPGS